MNEFKRLRKQAHRKAVALGIIRMVAKRTGMSVSAVSRTFAGKTDTPNKAVVAALHRAMVELGVEREFLS